MAAERAALAAAEADAAARHAALEAELGELRAQAAQAAADLAALEERARGLEADLQASADARKAEQEAAAAERAAERAAAARALAAEQDLSRTGREQSLMDYEHQRSREYLEKKALQDSIDALRRRLEAASEGRENAAMDYELQMSRLIEAAEAAFDDFEEQINQYNELSTAAAAAEEEFVLQRSAVGFTAGSGDGPPAAAAEAHEDDATVPGGDWDHMRAIRDKLAQVETYEGAVLGGDEAALRLRKRARWYVDFLNALLEKDVDLSPRSRTGSLEPFSRHSAGNSKLHGVVRVPGQTNSGWHVYIITSFTPCTRPIAPDR